MINDRTVRGIIAGAAGALAQNIYAYIVKMLGLTNVVYLDVSKAVLFRNHYNDIFANINALLGHFVVDSVLGVVFAFYIQATSSSYYLLKGVVFGTAVWFLVKVIGTNILNIPLFINLLPGNTLVFFVGALLFGLTTAWTLKLLNAEIKN